MPDAPRTATAHSHYDEMKLETTMTQVDTPETRQDGASRWDVRLGTWRAGIRRAIRIGSRPEPWKRGLVLAALALLLALVMLLHAEIPDWRWYLGGLAEIFLPWLRLLIQLLLVRAPRAQSGCVVAITRRA